MAQGRVARGRAPVAPFSIMYWRALLPSTLFSAFLLPACGGGGTAAADAKAADAKKADAKKAEEDAGIAKRRAEREAKDKAEEDRKAQRDKLTDELSVLPEKMPKKLDDACKGLVEAQQDFDKRHFPPETVAKLEAAAGTRLKMLEQQCFGSTKEMAACQIQVLQALPTGQEFHKDLPMFFAKCAQKFGGGGKAPAVPPKGKK